jgi:exosortase D (VPLPA-CTERM-specific)
MLQVCGMSAFREGNVIDLGFTRLQVVDACSGIRYLVPLIVMGILLAYYYKAPLWKKVLLVATTIPLSVVTNGFRIASVGLLYPIWGKEAAEGFFHDFSGWLIFMITLGMLLLEMWALRRIFPERAPAPPEPVSKAFVPGQAVKIASPQAVVAFLLLGATLAVAQGVNFREKVPSSRDFGQFPLQVGGWRGDRSVMPRVYIDTLKFTDYSVVDYRDSRGETVNFSVAWYDSQSKGRSIHSPETCLPGSGWTFEESGLATVPLAGAPGAAIKVKRAFMIKDGGRMLTYYWFPQRGRVLTDPVQLKFFAMWDALTRHRTDGALVRLITAVPQNGNLADAEARLQKFTRELVPVLSNYIPE